MKTVTWRKSYRERGAAHCLVQAEGTEPMDSRPSDMNMGALLMRSHIAFDSFPHRFSYGIPFRSVDNILGESSRGHSIKPPFRVESDRRLLG